MPQAARWSAEGLDSSAGVCAFSRSQLLGSVMSVGDSKMDVSFAPIHKDVYKISRKGSQSRTPQTESQSDSRTCPGATTNGSLSPTLLTLPATSSVHFHMNKNIEMVVSFEYDFVSG